MYVHVVDLKQEIVFSDLPEEYLYDAEKCNSEFEYKAGSNGIRKRHGKIRVKQGSIYLCSPGERLHNHEFKKIRDQYKTNSDLIFGIFRNIHANEREKTDSFKHNIVTCTAHLSQDLYKLIPENTLITRGAATQIEEISKIIIAEPSMAANAILEILKRLRFIKTEIDVYEMLYEKSESCRFQDHILHKVLYLSLYHFFRGLKEKNVEVNVEDSDLKGSCDYKSVSVILNNLFSNIEKYVMPNTPIHIKFIKLNDRANIVIDMVGLKVQPEEEKQLYNPKYSGQWAHKTLKAGSGMGLNIVKKICDATNAKIEINFNRDEELFDDGNIPYQPCRFILSVPALE